MAVRRRLMSLLTSGLIVGLLIVYFLPPKDAHAAFAAPRGYRVLATFVDTQNRAYIVDTNTVRNLGMVEIEPLVKRPIGLHPIVAGHVVPMFRTRWGWITGTLYFNKIETQLAQSTGFLMWMATLLPPPFGQLIPAYGAWITTAAGIARAHGRCLEIKSSFAVLDYAGRWCR